MCIGLKLQDHDNPELVINVIGEMPKTCFAKGRLRSTITNLIRMTGSGGNTWLLTDHTEVSAAALNKEVDSIVAELHS